MVAVIALAYPFLITPAAVFWPGFAVVVIAFVAGGVVFGRVATGPA